MPPPRAAHAPMLIGIDGVANAGPRSYVVDSGDTLLDVALEVGIDLADSYCLVAPDFRWEQPLVIGDILDIPPDGTICHEVVAGETSAEIALRYGVDPRSLFEELWNQLHAADGVDAPLTPGLHLRIPPVDPVSPGADEAAIADAGLMLPLLLNEKINSNPTLASAVGFPGAAKPAPRSSTVQAPVPENWPYGSGEFSWPLFGWLTQGFHPAHRAVDIAAPAGTVVTAADRGVVVRAGWNNQGYGLFVIIDHNIDYITLYAHLSEVLVEEGEVVAQGDLIGRVGSTGNSTGPHLHFEIRDFGRRTDPVPLFVR